MQHPRRDSSLTCSRRQFWPALLQEILLIPDYLKGRQAGQLSGLANLPDDQLAQVKPIVNPDYKISVNQGYVCGQGKRAQAALKLFAVAKENLLVFNLFDGRHTLGEIGERLSQEMIWEESKGFGYARDLFLSLAKRMVCVPKDPPGPTES